MMNTASISTYPPPAPPAFYGDATATPAGTPGYGVVPNYPETNISVQVPPTGVSMDKQLEVYKPAKMMQMPGPGPAGYSLKPPLGQAIKRKVPPPTNCCAWNPPMHYYNPQQAKVPNGTMMTTPKKPRSQPQPNQMRQNQYYCPQPLYKCSQWRTAKVKRAPFRSYEDAEVASVNGLKIIFDTFCSPMYHPATCFSSLWLPMLLDLNEINQKEEKAAKEKEVATQKARATNHSMENDGGNNAPCTQAHA